MIKLVKYSSHCYYCSNSTRYTEWVAWTRAQIEFEPNFWPNHSQVTHERFDSSKPLITTCLITKHLDPKPNLRVLMSNLISKLCITVVSLALLERIHLQRSWNPTLTSGLHLDHLIIMILGDFVFPLCLVLMMGLVTVTVTVAMAE